jgi:hypothetical protein
MNEDQKKGWIKIATGLILAVAGGVGIFFGRTVKQRFLRISILVLSAFSLGAGFYLMIDGTTDLALGVADQMVLSEENVYAMLNGSAPKPTVTQHMIFDSPAALKASLEPLKHQRGTENLRRLKYKCGDGSESFTVFVTALGTFGIPSISVTCADGMKLVEYTAK